MAFTVTSGVIPTAEKVVIYGPEGIGKSTFAAQFPDALFVDTEGGTKKLNVKRLPQPTSWAMLLDEADAVRRGEAPCGTLVIDTADWAERLCVRAVCAKAKVNGIEDFGYGKGYTYLKEEFGKLLDLLADVVGSGKNVVLTAHAQLSKFEQPDEMGQYDRWSMKTSKQVAPLLREWCDTLLFANYKTIVVKEGTGTNAKNKAQGGERVMYTSHHPCWDAKNRDGLPEMCPFDYGVIAPYIPCAAKQAQAPVSTAPAVSTPLATPAPAAKTETPIAHPLPSSEAEWEGVPTELKDLMVQGNVVPSQLRDAVGMKGWFPADMPIKDYPRKPDDFVAYLISVWPHLLKYIKDNCDLPF